MKTVRNLTYALGMLVLATTASAQFSPQTIDFTSSALWSAAAYNLGGNTGTFAIDTGTPDRVDFSASMAANSFLQAAIPFTATAPTTSSWSVSVSVTNLFASLAAADQGVQIGLLVSNTTDFGLTNMGHDYAKLVLAAVTNSRYIHGGLHIDGGQATAVSGQDNPKSVSGISTTTGSLVASFDHTTQVLTTGYNFNGTLIQFGSYGISSTGGGTTANTDWLSPTSFTISLYAQASSSPSGASYNLLSGNAYLDDFVTTSSTTAMTVIPEPSTYAALAGLGALGLAFWRRQRRAGLS